MSVLVWANSDFFGFYFHAENVAIDMQLGSPVGIVDLFLSLHLEPQKHNTEKMMLVSMIYASFSFFLCAYFRHFLEKCYRQNMEN